MASPSVARLRIYPFKSLDGVEIVSARVGVSGMLAHDREFALLGPGGALVNAKREPRVHALRASYDLGERRAVFESRLLGRSFEFGFDDERGALETFLGDHFERPIAVERDRSAGFPDDVRALGPTVVSTATIEAVAAWFPGLDAESVRRRLRANVEIGGVPAFWEDRLFGPGETVVPFGIGGAEFDGVNPCARCAVPSRDPESGETIAGFAKIVSQHRAATLPAWAGRSRFDHFYRLAVNARGARAAGRRIEVGDPVEAFASEPA